MIRIKLVNTERIKEFVQICQAFVSTVQIIGDTSFIDAKDTNAMLALDISENLYVRMLSPNIKELEIFDMAIRSFQY